MAICDKTYPKRLAFSFLDEIHKLFLQDYPLDQVEAVNRPYAFLKFGNINLNFHLILIDLSDNTIQRTKRSYQDIRAKQNMTRLQEELLDVSHIMTSNIKDVLERGNKLEKMSLMSDALASESKRYVRDARQLNLDALYRKYGTPTVLLAVVFLSLWIWIKYL